MQHICTGKYILEAFLTGANPNHTVPWSLLNFNHLLWDAQTVQNFFFGRGGEKCTVLIYKITTSRCTIGKKHSTFNFFLAAESWTFGHCVLFSFRNMPIFSPDLNKSQCPKVILGQTKSSLTYNQFSCVLLCYREGLHYWVLRLIACFIFFCYNWQCDANIYYYIILFIMYN